MTDTFTGGVLASLAPWAPAGSDFYKYTQALAACFEPVFGIVWDQGSPDDPENFTAGWSTLLDPDACPAAYLPWLGMFVGVYVAPGTPEADARALIKAEQGFVRGNPATIIAAAQRFLIGSQSCVILERTAADGSQDAYHFILTTRPEETQPVNLIPNPSFEYDTLGGSPAAWTIIFGGTFDVVNTWAASGRQSLWRVDTSIISGEAHGAYAGPIAVTAGFSYAFQATVNVNYNQMGPLTLRIVWQDSGHSTLSTSVIASTSALGVTVLSGANVSAPASAAYALFEVEATSTGASQQISFYLDAALMVQVAGSVAPDYFDGDISGNGWTGTPGDSTSQRTLAGLTAAVNAAKPAGVWWTLVQEDWTIGALEGAYATIGAVEAAFASIGAVEGDVT